MRIPKGTFQYFDAICCTHKQNCCFFIGRTLGVYVDGNPACEYVGFCNFSNMKINTAGCDLTETLYKKVILIAEIEGVDKGDI